MDHEARINLEINGHLINFKFFETLKCLSSTWSQRKAAEKLGISHPVLNRRIKEVEGKLKIKIVKTTPRGSGLTSEGLELLYIYEKYLKRLKKREKIVIGGGFISSNLVGNLASQFGLDSLNYSTDDESAVHLFNMDMLDILTLDDPIYAFKNDLKFNPIAYDYLSLIASSQELLSNKNNLNDLNYEKFVSVTNSTQRLAWNTLDSLGVEYQIVNECKSPLEAYKIVKDNNNLYSFLNASSFPGKDIIKRESKHIISIIISNEDDKDLNAFLEYVLSEGQDIVEEEGFDKII
ncbi:MAG: LysR family transcriptional regulator [Methanobacteriaceae archaeon]